MITNRFLTISLLTIITLSYVNAMDELKNDSPDIITSSKFLNLNNVPGVLKKKDVKNNEPIGEEIDPNNNVYTVSYWISLKDVANDIKDKTVKILDAGILYINTWEAYDFEGFKKGLILEGNDICSVLFLLGNYNINVYNFLVLRGNVNICYDYYDGKISMNRSNNSDEPIIDVSELIGNFNDGDDETIINGNSYTTLKYLTDEELNNKTIESIETIRTRVKNILDQGLRLQDVNIYNYKVCVEGGGGNTNPITLTLDEKTGKYNVAYSPQEETVELFDDGIIKSIENYNNNYSNKLSIKDSNIIIKTSQHENETLDFYTAFNKAQGEVIPNSEGNVLSLDRNTTLKMCSTTDDVITETSTINTDIVVDGNISIDGLNEVETLVLNGDNSKLTDYVNLIGEKFGSVVFNKACSIVSLNGSSISGDKLTVQFSDNLGEIEMKGIVAEQKDVNLNVGSENIVYFTNSGLGNNKQLSYTFKNINFGNNSEIIVGSGITVNT